jgi:predicted aspartyl protease
MVAPATKETTMKTTFCTAALFAFALVSAQATAATDDVPVSIDQTGAIVVPVTINGQGPFRFLLDTGSNRTSIRSDVAERLGLPVVAKTTMVTASGSRLYLVVKLQRTAIGSSAAEGLLAPVMPATELKGMLATIDGIIGQDFLSAFNYTLDYRWKRLTWTSEADGAGADTRLELIDADGRFLLELPADEQHPTALRFVPDSGADVLTVFERNGRTPLALHASRGEAEVTTLVGLAAGKMAVLPTLRVGGATLKNQPVVIVPRDAPDAPAGDGLLPLHFFASVSFNSKERYFVARAR